LVFSSSISFALCSSDKYADGTEAAQLSSGVTATKILPLFKDPERLTHRLKEIPPEGVYLMRDSGDRII